MSFETDLDALLKTICPRTYPDVAPFGATTPYITWNTIGGEALRFGDNTAPDKRNAVVQVDVWSKSRLEAINTIRQVEDAICNSSLWQAKPEGEAVSRYEPDDDLRGSLQRFNVWFAR